MLYVCDKKIALQHCSWWMILSQKISLGFRIKGLHHLNWPDWVSYLQITAVYKYICNLLDLVPLMTFRHTWKTPSLRGINALKVQILRSAFSATELSSIHTCHSDRSLSRCHFIVNGLQCQETKQAHHSALHITTNIIWYDQNAWHEIGRWTSDRF